MKILEGKALSTALRAAVDSAEKRLWIASPYIGGWPKNVRRILGTHWQSNVSDVRLLTDVEERGFRVNTLQQFFRRGEVRSLRGLHAKLYVADDFVVATSANLTGTAFSRRYETGVQLSGAAASQGVRLFEKWWQLPKAKTVREEQLLTPKAGGSDPDRPGGPPLVIQNELSPDAEDDPLPSDGYGDYTVFLDAFRDLASQYSHVQRIWPKTPLNFEVDGLLNYLFFHAAGVPSRPYRRKTPRQLSSATRIAEIRRYGKQFASAYRKRELGNDASWRGEHARVVRELLTINKKTGLTRGQLAELLDQVNAMQFYGVNRAKVLNPRNNPLQTIRSTLRHLTDETVPVQRRMSDCTGRVVGLGKSAIQELVGFYSNGRYPLRNANTNCGLRFFGYDVRIS